MRPSARSSPGVVQGVRRGGDGAPRRADRARPGRRRVRVGAGGVQARAARGDARGGRAAGLGVGGDPLEPQTLLLWSRLTLADAPRARPETNEDDPKARRAEASAADALAGVFREAFRRRQRCATESTDRVSPLILLRTVRRPCVETRSIRARTEARTTKARTTRPRPRRRPGCTAWTFCARGGATESRRRVAARQLRVALASPAREKLADVVSAAAAKDRRLTTTTDAEARKPRDTVTARRSVSNEASSSEEASAVFVAKDEETTRKRGSSFSRRTTNSLRATLDAGLGSIVDTVNESFGVSLDCKDTATRLGAAAAAAAAAVVVAYAVVAEATRNQTRRRGGGDFFQAVRKHRSRSL